MLASHVTISVHQELEVRLGAHLLHRAVLGTVAFDKKMLEVATNCHFPLFWNGRRPYACKPSSTMGKGGGAYCVNGSTVTPAPEHCTCVGQSVSLHVCWSLVQRCSHKPPKHCITGHRTGLLLRRVCMAWSGGKGSGAASLQVLRVTQGPPVPLSGWVCSFSKLWCFCFMTRRTQPARAKGFEGADHAVVPCGARARCASEMATPKLRFSWHDTTVEGWAHDRPLFASMVSGCKLQPVPFSHDALVVVISRK